MSFGFTPSFTGKIILDNYTKSNALVFAKQVCEIMNLEVRYITEVKIIAYTNNILFTRQFHCKITIQIEKSIVSITSASTNIEMYDKGMNKKKVNEFTSIFYNLVELYTREKANKNKLLLSTLSY